MQVRIKCYVNVDYDPKNIKRVKKVILRGLRCVFIMEENQGMIKWAFRDIDYQTWS